MAGTLVCIQSSSRPIFPIFDHQHSDSLHVKFVTRLEYISSTYFWHFLLQNSIPHSNKNLPTKSLKRELPALCQPNRMMNSVPSSAGIAVLSESLLTRRLPEFKFWHSATRATAIAFLCTWFTFFDVPYKPRPASFSNRFSVYYPILVLYFCILFVITMKRQIQHMIKYKV